MSIARRILYLVALLLFSSRLQAAVMVSPVIIDAYQVERGSAFTVTMMNPKTYPLDVALEWGWFTMSSDGTVLLDEKAAPELDWLYLSNPVCHLEPESTTQIVITVNRADFTAVTPVLYISLQDPQSPVAVRVAVLFALSSEQPTRPVQIEFIESCQTDLRIRVTNPNPCHIYFDGVVELYRSAELIDEISITPKLVLAQSQRDISVPLNPGADQVIVTSDAAAADLMVVLPVEL
ncbi:MAG TPA: hypothetical protein GX739_02880 [Firmicutes bacterium]|nr:hypothetical protein [Bacillota bacterium]